MTKYEVGTLKEIGAQVGDVVEWNGGYRPNQWTITLIRGGNYYEGDDHFYSLNDEPYWRIITRTNNVTEVDMKLTIITALAFSVPTIASANGCPSNTVWNGWQCIAPQGGGETGSTINNDNTNTATGVGIGTGVGVGTGIGHGGAGGQGGAGGEGGSATSTATGGNATGGRGGNSSVRGSGNSSSRSGVSGSGNSTNNISIKNRAAAAQANSGSLAVCDGEYASSGFQTAIVGMAITKCVKDRFEQVIIAEDIYVTQGRTWGAIYLAGKDNGINNKTRQLGITETSGDLSQRRKAARDAATQTRFGAPVHAGSEPMAARQIAPATTQTVRCPETHPVYVDGKGCRK